MSEVTGAISLISCGNFTIFSPPQAPATNTIGRVPLISPLVSMTTAFSRGSQSGIYELFICHQVCELVFMHYILHSHSTNSSAHTRSHLSLYLGTAVEVWIYPDLSSRDVWGGDWARDAALQQESERKGWLCFQRGNTGTKKKGPGKRQNNRSRWRSNRDTTVTRWEQHGRRWQKPQEEVGGLNF